MGFLTPLARKLRCPCLLLALGALFPTPAASAQTPDVAGRVGFELRGFPHDAVNGNPADADISVVVQPELEWAWADGDQRLRFVPFARLDQADDERTHVDVREAIWMVRGHGWELAAGVGRVFWGVTESQHLVDIINQTDLVENIDGEDKLGQPMVNLTLLRGWGALNLFVLPGFRERTYPGAGGRFRPPQPVDSAAAVFESDAGRTHVDFAARWSHYIGDWDVGVAHFHGTGREPTLLPTTEGALVPYYEIIDQTGIDLTAAKGDMLWKLEAINRFGQGDRFAAFTGGFEYTLVGGLGTAWDLGILAEYLWDERGAEATTPFEDDFFAGFRFAFNDMQSSDLLAGLVIDRDSGASLVNLEMSRRLGERYRLELEGRFFLGVSASDQLFYFQGDDYVSLEISRFF